MSPLPPLTIAIPFTAAALLAALGGRLPRPVTAGVAVAVAAGTTGLQFAQLLAAWPGGLTYWFGRWRPERGVALGVVFTVDPLDAGLACVVGVLMVAALVYSSRGVTDVSHLYHVLMLVFLGGMSGFALSGDLFDLFVFFELMSVAGFGLCSFRNTSSSVVHGALNFAVANSVGAMFFLMGIALVYGHTGSLNLAAIAASLHGHPPSGVVVVSFVFVLVGLLTKAGAVPFHFWLSDAYAVAAAPVGALYAGVMSDLAYHAVAKIYAQGYAGGLAAAAPGVRGLLVGVGVVTVVVGAVMCFLQADIKRQLAFLVISHGGVFLCGIGLLSPEGLAGSTLYVAADGMLKGGLFLVVGFTVVVLGASDELLLHGRGRRRDHWPAGVLLALAGLGLAALPGTGTWLSGGLLTAAAAHGYGWLPALTAAGTAVCAAAVLRSAARVYLGWGPDRDPLLTSDQPDEPSEGEPTADDRRSLPRWLLLPAAGLLVAGYGMSAAPHLAGDAVAAARSFLDLPGYLSTVLHGRPPAAPRSVPAVRLPAAAWGYGGATTAAAVALAALGLWWRRVPGWLVRPLRPARRPVDALKSVHSGRVGDLAAWLTVGAVALCAAGAAVLR